MTEFLKKIHLSWRLNAFKSEKIKSILRSRIPIVALAIIYLACMGILFKIVSDNNQIPDADRFALKTTVQPAPGSGKSSLAGFLSYFPVIKLATVSVVPTATLPSATQTPAVSGGTVMETFEGNPATWNVAISTGGTGHVSQSQSKVFRGSNSALLSTSGSGSTARVGALGFSDPAVSHTWGERPGAWFWQRAMVYLPSATLQALGAQDYIDLAGFWPGSGGAYGWWLRLRRDANANAVLSVYGYDADGKAAEFNIYGSFPLDRWVDLTVCLHSQSGPGVKRSFAVLIDGQFYGWYNQGHMGNETYDQASIGIIRSTASNPLNVYIDQWYAPDKLSFPEAPDNRSTALLQTQDFRSLSGVQWQIDWSTWENALTMDPTHGLYSADRLQSGRNIDRMPGLENGWAQIEFDWPNGAPPANSYLTGSFSGLIGFHKEINREQNLEISPIIINGKADLVYDDWTGNANILASWTLPPSTLLNDGRNIPEPGDILRIHWQQVGAYIINVKASYYDASTTTWYKNVINSTEDLSSVPSQDASLPDKVNFLDEYHRAVSITIDTPFYSIRQFTAGDSSTYPGP